MNSKIAATVTVGAASTIAIERFRSRPALGRLGSSRLRGGRHVRGPGARYRDRSGRRRHRTRVGGLEPTAELGLRWAIFPQEALIRGHVFVPSRCRGPT
jgi:hypothetical protein